MGMNLRRPNRRRIAAAFALTCAGIVGVGATDIAADQPSAAVAESRKGSTNVYIVQTADPRSSPTTAAAPDSRRQPLGKARRPTRTAPTSGSTRTS